ncbi:MAG: hypothetical protein PVG70_15410 [Desulfobacterales bacterium]
MELVFFLKVIVTVCLVLILSIVAEYISPRAAGILAGYPLGAAIVLFFIGLEMGPKFASNSAVYTMIGLVATQSFVYFYFKSILLFERWNILIASIFAVIGYFVVIWILHFVTINKYLAILIPSSSVILFVYLFREIKNVTIREKINLSHKVLFLRAIMATFIILIITGVSRLVGSTWAGLFSAFPMTLFPLILIIHITYEKEHVFTIIKNFPLGLGSLIIYSLTVSIVYPIYGVFLGTVISLIAASVYLIMFFFFSRRINK